MKNCIFCDDFLSPEKGELIWRGDDCRVILVNEPLLPGFCRVIWNRHVSEMSDLSFGERDVLMSLVFAVEETVRQVMQPSKMNLASFGNHVPHIHWHVIPRYADDAFFPGSAWSEKVQETPAPILEARKERARGLGAAIRAAISQLH
jgi:diadenosine tetraphosphate (Ap4A) HIT family hydrolase